MTCCRDMQCRVVWEWWRQICVVLVLYHCRFLRITLGGTHFEQRYVQSRMRLSKAGNVQFASALPSRVLFSLYTNAFIAEQVCEGNTDFSAWVQKEVFIFDQASGVWDAEWRCGVDTGLPPGFTPDTVSQALESLWGHLKQSLSVSVVHKDITVATKKVEAAIVAGWIHSGWLLSDADRQGCWKVRSEVGGMPWPLTHSAWSSPRLLSGDVEASERLKFEDDLQRKTPAVVWFAQAAPANFQVSAADSILGMPARRFYTVPAYTPSMTIDSQTHATFMQLFCASTEADLMLPLRKLGVCKKDTAYPSGERVSLARFRTLFSELAGVAVLRQPVFGHTVVCLCRTFWPKRGQCVHELLVRWLEGDAQISLGDLQALTRGRGVQTMAAVDQAARARALGHAYGQTAGRPAAMLTAAAWVTLDEIKRRAISRSEARRQAAGLSEATRVMFRSPAAKAKKVAVPQSGQARPDEISRLAKKVSEPEFMAYFDGLKGLAKLQLTADELKESGAVHIMRVLRSARQTPLPAQLLISKIFDGAVQQANAAKRRKLGSGSAASASADPPQTPPSKHRRD